MSARVQTRWAATALGAVLALVAGCGEKPQTAATRKADTAPYATAAGSVGHSVGQWGAGDAAAWDRHLANRAQSQNEYLRTGTRAAGGTAVAIGTGAAVHPVGATPAALAGAPADAAAAGAAASAAVTQATAAAAAGAAASR